ncbi:MAG TPA: DHA2 family efflux MFS transporter permease subunit [Ktedonobacterales bacterium]|nr:DHA2 family efflux MFS transporter permease subunit [Ktedonobacterales bacterium]
MRLAYKWKVLISVIFGIFMVILDTTVVNVAFPTLRTEYGASVNDSQWIISVYVMALGISTPLSGFLADRFSMKRVYLIGLICFVVGSLLCGVSPSLGVLVAARALQGFGGGLALPLGTALLFSAFTVREQGLAFGIFGIALVVAPALGPILGGWLVDQNLWRWIFFINVPIGALGIVLAGSFLRREATTLRPRLDLLGLLTSAIGFSAVLYAASVAADAGWTAPNVLGGFIVGGIFLLAFALVELFVARDPLLDLRLFKRWVFTNATLVGYVSVLALFGAEFLLPLYLQILRGRTALETGFILLPLALASGVAAPLSGKLYDVFGPRPLMVVGFGILTVNTWQFAQLDATTPISWIAFLLVLRGIALGLTVQTTLVASLSVVSQPEVSRASALSNSTRQVVQSIGVALLATVLASALTAPVKQLQSQVPAVANATGAQPIALCAINSPADLGLPAAVPGSGIPGGPSPQQIVQLAQRACAEYLNGFDSAYTLTVYFALLAMLLGALLPGWPGRWAGRRAHQPPAEAGPDTDSAADSAAGAPTQLAH